MPAALDVSNGSVMLFERNAALREFVHHLGGLADLAGEPIDADDHQRIEGPGIRVEQHLLEPRTVHVRAGLGVAVELEERPIVAVLGLAEGLEAVLLGPNQYFCWSSSVLMRL